jgi:hypothetical protein
MMSAAADGDIQVVLSPEIYSMDNIGYIAALGDQGWAYVNHGIVDFARLVVLRVAGFNQLAAHLSS